MNQTNPRQELCALLLRRPDAQAEIVGGGEASRVRGGVRFYQTRYGVLVSAEIRGLPRETDRCPNGIFGFHIHAGGRCTGDRDDPFADAGGHYNPRGCPHPAHAGDLPPLFSNDGFAFSVFLTDRFTVREIIGRTVIIHGGVDDFTGQPGGNSGERIACGEIRRAGAR